MEAIGMAFSAPLVLILMVGVIAFISTLFK